jgi:hypothetical protein
MPGCTSTGVRTITRASRTARADGGRRQPTAPHGQPQVAQRAVRLRHRHRAGRASGGDDDQRVAWWPTIARGRARLDPVSRGGATPVCGDPRVGARGSRFGPLVRALPGDRHGIGGCRRGGPVGVGSSQGRCGSAIRAPARQRITTSTSRHRGHQCDRRGVLQRDDLARRRSHTAPSGTLTLPRSSMWANVSTSPPR